MKHNQRLSLKTVVEMTNEPTIYFFPKRDKSAVSSLGGKFNWNSPVTKDYFLRSKRKCNFIIFFIQKIEKTIPLLINET